MMRRFILFCGVLLTLIGHAPGAYADDTRADANAITNPSLGRAFAMLPVLYEGRVIPMASFARTMQAGIAGTSRLQGINATEWLAELIFHPERAYTRPVFKIAHPEARTLLGLADNPDTNNRYAVRDFGAALLGLGAEFEAWGAQVADQGVNERTELSKAQIALLTLYQQVDVYYALSGSLNTILPLFEVAPEDGPILGLHAGTYDFLQFDTVAQTALNYVGGLDLDARAAWSARDHRIASLANRWLAIREQASNGLLRVIPPQTASGAWHSVQAIWSEGLGNPNTVAWLNMWREMATEYREGRTPDNAARTLMGSMNYDKAHRVRAEYYYHTIAPLRWTAVVLLVAFLLYALAQKARVLTVARWAVLAGFALLTTTIAARVFILARPPVATLYESILWVAWATALFAIIAAYRMRDRAVAMLAVIATLVLLWVATQYAENSTFGVLAAVLNNNFWLTTHVLVITLGYGATIMAASLAHLAMWHTSVLVRGDAAARLYRQVCSVAIVAVFLTAFGTILGGIWADQSWGRFWGWDPKENGALAIVLWLLLLLHGVSSGFVSRAWFLRGMMFANVVVALAWFGVNLLGVGLHAYGFTEGAAWGLGLFCAAQCGVIALSCIRWRGKMRQHSV